MHRGKGATGRKSKERDSRNVEMGVTLKEIPERIQERKVVMLPVTA